MGNAKNAKKDCNPGRVWLELELIKGLLQSLLHFHDILRLVQQLSIVPPVMRNSNIEDDKVTTKREIILSFMHCSSYFTNLFQIGADVEAFYNHGNCLGFRSHFLVLFLREEQIS